MRPLSCVAIDDEPLAISLIKSYVDATASLLLLETFTDAIAAADYLKEHQVDLLFLDIQMPDISGIDLFKNIAEKPMVIFTTAFRDFAYEGFELNAVDYLLKPIEYIRFKQAITKALKVASTAIGIAPQTDCIFVHSEYQLIKIDLRDILYLESLEDYVKIHLHNGKMILTLMPLKKMLEKLPQSKFMRIHRSFVVATRAISAVMSRKIKLHNGLLLPISDSYSAEVAQWVKL